MLEQIKQRTGVRPSEILVDGGYPGHDAIDAAAERDVVVYAPLPKPRQGDSRDPHLPRDGDSQAVAAWRRRMVTDQAKAIYKERAATAETVNADAKAHRGLDQLAVRGCDKVLGSASLFALTYNILRLISLRRLTARRPRPPRRRRPQLPRAAVLRLSQPTAFSRELAICPAQRLLKNARAVACCVNLRRPLVRILQQRPPPDRSTAEICSRSHCSKQ